jgi:hypothetical protein
MAKQASQLKEKSQPAATTSKQTLQTMPFIFGRTNYLMMMAGVIVILLGFVLILQI